MSLESASGQLLATAVLLAALPMNLGQNTTKNLQLTPPAPLRVGSLVLVLKKQLPLRPKPLVLLLRLPLAPQQPLRLTRERKDNRPPPPRQAVARTNSPGKFALTGRPARILNALMIGPIFTSATCCGC